MTYGHNILNNVRVSKGQTEEFLLRGRTRTIGLLVRTKFKSAAFYIENNIYLLLQNEEVNRTEPFPSVSIPWSDIGIIDRLHRIATKSYKDYQRLPDGLNIFDQNILPCVVLCVTTVIYDRSDGSLYCNVLLL
jgi:hypothetical protein